jgi:hypothetical protein
MRANSLSKVKYLWYGNIHHSLKSVVPFAYITPTVDLDKLLDHFHYNLTPHSYCKVVGYKWVDNICALIISYEVISTNRKITNSCSVTLIFPDLKDPFEIQSL